jgi:hypothetical protein
MPFAPCLPAENVHCRLALPVLHCRTNCVGGCPLRSFVCRANLFRDDTASAYLSLIHKSRPDTVSFCTVSITCYHCTSLPLLPTHQASCYQNTCKAGFQARG